ncbi:hypothetical protein DFR29_101127 [Tahibacter aquaticus]|uniref:DUF1566 domain-containing protein n=1 Tax=Tahibacter aquaticus TaxID=520092 RepID=A0A4R6Z9C1_9GAMM|nr:flagellar hook-length control protein [Tahibacter aquaticus]TDR48507.1 hypothetical protein DFR29_101127 [Tahibacter aquaticus]
MPRQLLAVLLSFLPAIAAQAQEARGMSWGSSSNDATGSGVVFVGCHGLPRSAQGGCDAYQGDTDCRLALPLLCISVDGRPRPGGLITAGKGHAMPADFYAGWAAGEVRAGWRVAGLRLRSRAAADALCATQFGNGWRLAEFHDGVREGSGENGVPASHGGWAFYANGALAQDTRYWVANFDTAANCWDKSAVQQMPQISR